MSGPKGVQVRVVDQAELERRALTAARAQLSVVVARADRLRAEAQAHGVADAALRESLTVRATPDRSAGCHRAAADLAASCDRAEATVRTRLAERAVEQVQTALTGGLGRDDGIDLRVAPAAVVAGWHADPTAPALTAGAPAGEADTWRPEVAARVMRTIGRLGDVDTDDRRLAQELAEQILREPSAGRATSLLMILQDDVATARRRAQSRHALAREAEDVLARLACLPPEAADPLRERVQTLIGSLERDSGPTPHGRLLPAWLYEQVEEAERAATAEADRAFALAVAAQCLQELGYEVEEGFETVQPGQLAYARHREWRHHGVQLRAGPGSSQLSLNVVRASGEPPTDRDARREDTSAEDTQVEVQWCTDLRRAQQKALTRGVELQVVRARDAGSLPVQVVPSERVARIRKRRRAVPRAMNVKP